MKPFNLKQAQAGAQVCTRDKRPVRILCYDKIGGFPIIALVLNTVKGKTEELLEFYTLTGKYFAERIAEDRKDLFMAEKGEIDDVKMS